MTSRDSLEQELRSLDAELEQQRKQSREIEAELDRFVSEVVAAREAGVQPGSDHFKRLDALTEVLNQERARSMELAKRTERVAQELRALLTSRR